MDRTTAGLAEAMLAFHRRWDLDLITIMSSGVSCGEDWGCKVAYTGSPGGAKRCTEHALRSLPDRARITPLDPGAGARGRWGVSWRGSGSSRLAGGRTRPCSTRSSRPAGPSSESAPC